MKHALSMPNFGTFADFPTLLHIARAADERGWDGLFLWDHMQSEDHPALDPWIALAAIAMSTTNLRIGTMVSPIARRRPWKLSRELVSLDHLSNGRVIAGFGIGGDWWREFSAYGEDPADRRHAEMLDEGLEIITNLWTGDEFSYRGTHYQITDVRHTPAPRQQPRIPIWLAAGFPGKRPIERAAQWDGVFPLHREERPWEPEDVRALVAAIGKHRTSDTPFDIVITTHDHTPDNGFDTASSDYRQRIQDLDNAGVTWGVEGFGPTASIDQVLHVIDAGPPLNPEAP